jgi:uncharacterized cupin superfamily protein
MARIADGEVPVREGDYVAFPIGPTGAHQEINDTDRPLRILMISTMNEPEIAVYPDSRKVGLFAGSAPGGDPSVRSVFTFLPESSKAGYWHGED